MLSQIETSGARSAQGGEGLSGLRLEAGLGGARLVFYAGQPTGEPIISHGPFIADTPDEIRELYRKFRQGELHHINEVPETQRLVY